MSTVVPLGIYINTYGGISIVTVANLYRSMYDSTVNLSTSVVHVVLVVVHSSSYEKCRIGRHSVVEYRFAEGHKKNREHNLCCQNAALCVGIRVVVVVVLLGTIVFNKIVPIPLFQKCELILTDRNCYDWLKKSL